MPSVRLEGLRKQFGEVLAVNDVSVEFRDDNQMVVAFNGNQAFTFGLSDATTGQAERIVRIPHAAFERLAV